MLTIVLADGSGHEDRKGGPPSLIDVVMREDARRMLSQGCRPSTTAVFRYIVPVFGDSGWFWPGAGGVFAK